MSETKADKWNSDHPVGTQVVFTPVKGRPEVERTKTRGRAWTLGDGEAVVQVDGRPGGVALSHIEIA